MPLSCTRPHRSDAGPSGCTLYCHTWNPIRRADLDLFTLSAIRDQEMGRSSLKLESVGDTTKVERNQRAVQLTEHQPPNQAVSLTCSQCLSLDHEPSCPMEVLSLVQVRSRMVHDTHASHLESKERDSTTEGEELCSRIMMRRALNHLAAHGLHGGGELRPMLHGISINPEDLRRDEKVLDGTHLQRARWRCSLP